MVSCSVAKAIVKRPGPTCELRTCGTCGHTVALLLVVKPVVSLTDPHGHLEQKHATQNQSTSYSINESSSFQTL
jgi:hypothetical protein